MMAASEALERILPVVHVFLREAEHRYPVKEAYIFGSYALGEAGPESDIDLAVISEAFSGQRFEDNVALSKLTWGIDTRIEPIAFRPEALQADTPLTIAIRRTGIRVYPGQKLQGSGGNDAP